MKENMSKENTLNTLKKIPFEQVEKEWMDSPLAYFQPEAKEWFQARGWIWEEYLHENDKRYK